MDAVSDILRCPEQNWNLIILEICEDPFDLEKFFFKKKIFVSNFGCF